MKCSRAIAMAGSVPDPYGGGAYQARKTHCLRGHLYDDANTYIDPKGGRLCRTCFRERAAEKRRKEAVRR